MADTTTDDEDDDEDNAESGVETIDTRFDRVPAADTTILHTELLRLAAAMDDGVDEWAASAAASAASSDILKPASC